MPNTQYTDDQKTPWFGGDDLPIRPGRYEMRMRMSKEILDGIFSGGRWKIEYDGKHHAGPTNLRTFEWRGLNSEPKNEPSSEMGRPMMEGGQMVWIMSS